MNRTKLKQIVINITDGEHGSVKDEPKSSYFLLSNKNIIDGYIKITPKDRRISEESFNKIQKRTKLSKGDVVIATVGTIGKSAIIKNEYINFDFQRSVGIIKPDNEKILSEYLYYYLRLPYVQKQLGNRVNQSVQKCLYIGDIENLEIDFCNIKDQHKIISVLSTLDTKIELNNKTNVELEQIAKTLYDYWFVQFNFPDENGKPYKSSGGEMVYNNELKRNIPEGWDVGNLLDIADYTNGLACQKYRPLNNNVLKVIKIKEMHDGFSAETEFVRDDIPAKIIIENGDILFSWSASLEVQIWSKGKGALNQHIFKVTSDKYPKSFYYFQLLNYLHHFKMMAENRKTTMGHITQEHLEQSRIVLPLKELTLKLENIISPIFLIMINNEIENQKLTELRDWLLPMLMNGQVRVN